MLCHSLIFGLMLSDNPYFFAGIRGPGSSLLGETEHEGPGSRSRYSPNAIGGQSGMRWCPGSRSQYSRNSTGRSASTKMADQIALPFFPKCHRWSARKTLGSRIALLFDVVGQSVFLCGDSRSGTLNLRFDRALVWAIENASVCQ